MSNEIKEIHDEVRGESNLQLLCFLALWLKVWLKTIYSKSILSGYENLHLFIYLFTWWGLSWLVWNSNIMEANRHLEYMSSWKNMIYHFFFFFNLVDISSDRRIYSQQNVKRHPWRSGKRHSSLQSSKTGNQFEVTIRKRSGIFCWCSYKTD